MFKSIALIIGVSTTLSTAALEPAKEGKSACQLEFTIPKKYVETESSGDVLRYVHDRHQSTLVVEKHDEFESSAQAKGFALMRYETITNEAQHTEVLMQQAEIDGLDCYLISYVVHAGTAQAKYELVALSRHCDFIYEWTMTSRIEDQFRVVPEFFEMLESAEPADV